MPCKDLTIFIHKLYKLRHGDYCKRQQQADKELLSRNYGHSENIARGSEHKEDKNKQREYCRKV